MLSHGAVASRYFDEEIVNEALEDWTKARVSPQAKATLGMLHKLTVRPQEFSTVDIESVLETGVSIPGVEQALVAAGFVFNYQNRMADALGADIPRDKLQQAGRMLNLIGRRPIPHRRPEKDIDSLGSELPTEVQALYQSICFGDGDSDIALRKAIVERSLRTLGFDVQPAPIPESIQGYVDTINRYAPDITDQDIQNLLAHGWSEEDIFEFTVAASFGAAYGRLKIGWDALLKI